VETLLKYGLLAVFVALVLTSFGLPIPEDVSLVAAGALARTGHSSWLSTIFVGYVGVLTGDVIAFMMGRRVGLHPTGWLGRMFDDHHIERIMRFYRRFGDWTVVICRNLPGMRFPAFFFSGATGMPLKRFLLLDGLAAVVTVGVWVNVGWAFGDNMAEWLHILDNARWILMAGGVGLAAWVLWTWFGRRPQPEEE
jgi:membrane protein DedA with SNARE-associated domain